MGREGESGSNQAVTSKIVVGGQMKSGAPIRAKRSRPPYNPGLRQFIESKQAGAVPLNAADVAKGFRSWRARGYLPHFDAPGTLQFITFCLHDAMPASRRSEWEACLKVEDSRERRRRLEMYIDRGFGECWLRDPRVAQIVANALNFFDGKKYRLDEWVVMPNHVHLIVDIWQSPLSEILHSWKRFTAGEANKILGREGRFWQREYWDTLIRDEEHLLKTRRYIQMNPVKAGLTDDPSKWLWGSAAFARTKKDQL